MAKMVRKKSTDFIAMWNSEGLECIFNLSEWKVKDELWEQAKIWSTLKDEKHHPRELVPLQHMLLRAKVNSQRFYEIYTFRSDPGIDEETIRELFENTPQFIVDFIRKNGTQVYSDRARRPPVIV